MEVSSSLYAVGEHNHFLPAQKNTENDPLVDPQNIFLPSHQVWTDKKLCEGLEPVWRFSVSGTEVSLISYAKMDLHQS
jgi:hypothetical protein